MSDWLHNLPVTWMALVVFGFTYLLAGCADGQVSGQVSGFAREKAPARRG